MTESGRGPSEADLEKLARFATILADGIEAALPGWVERSVSTICERSGVMMTGTLRARARTAGVEATDVIAPQVRAVLMLDIDDQRTGPLEIVRTAVRWPTAVLQSASVPEVPRDESARSMFPDDLYDLTPGSFRDLDLALHDPGLEWGAAKAHVHLARRRSAG